MDQSSKRKRWAAVAVAAAIVSALAVLFLFNPEANRFFPPCPLHWLTGLHCSGCGTLRALHHLLHGRLAAALALNSLTVVSIPIVALLLLNPAWSYRRWVPWTAMAVLIGYGILRNLPLWPFMLLAPH